MKKFITILIGCLLLTATVSVSFAGDRSPSIESKIKKKETKVSTIEITPERNLPGSFKEVAATLKIPYSDVLDFLSDKLERYFHVVTVSDCSDTYSQAVSNYNYAKLNRPKQSTINAGSDVEPHAIGGGCPECPIAYCWSITYSTGGMGGPVQPLTEPDNPNKIPEKR